MARTTLSTVVGKAARFTGSTATDRVNTNYSTDSSLRSFSFWAYRTADGGGNLGRMFDKITGGSSTESFINDTSSSGIYTYERVFSTTTGKWRIVRPSADAWHHIVITFDSSSVNNDPIIYVDGVSASVTEISTPVGTANTNSDPYIIGNRGSDKARCWAGYIDDFRIYNRILTQAEVTSLYNSGDERNGLVLHLDFDGGVSSQVRDSVAGLGAVFYGFKYITGTVNRLRRLA